MRNISELYAGRSEGLVGGKCDTVANSGSRHNMNITKSFVFICVLCGFVIISCVTRFSINQDFYAVCDHAPTAKLSNGAKINMKTRSAHSTYWALNKDADIEMKTGVNITDMNSSTDPRHTSVSFEKGTTFYVGNVFRAVIVARNYRNERKLYGGDFFQAILFRTAVAGDGIAAKIVDYNNGTYSIHARLVWKGATRLRVVLIHPAEAVIALKLKTSEEHGDGFGYKSEVYHSQTRKTEVLKCGAFLRNKNQACNFSNPTYGERWYCERPHGGCNLITSYGRDDFSRGTKRWKTEWIEYLNKSQNWMNEVTGSGRYFEVKKSSRGERRDNRPPCEPGVKGHKEGQHVAGWFEDNQWHSSICKNRPFSAVVARRCLKSHDFYIMGDSTARQLFPFITHSLKLTEQSSSSNTSFQPRHSYSSADGIDIFYRAHGPPLQHYGTFKQREYLSTVLDRIGPPPTSNRRVAIVLSFGLHFLSFRTSYFQARVDAIKLALSRLRRRIPSLKVVVKGINFHYEFGYALPRAQWLCYRMNSILKAAFTDISYVAFVDTWDMTLVQTPTEVHPRPHMIRHQMGLLMSYICPD